MKHKAQLGWITRTQKTAKTECGKRVLCSQIAIESDTDCPACKNAVDEACKTLVKIAEHAVIAGADAKVIADAHHVAADPKRYQTTYFL